MRESIASFARVLRIVVLPDPSSASPPREGTKRMPGACDHAAFDAYAFDVENWDEMSPQSEVWTAKPKQAEIWAPAGQQAEAWNVVRED